MIKLSGFLLGATLVLLSMSAMHRLSEGGSLLWLWLPVLTVAAIITMLRKGA